MRDIVVVMWLCNKLKLSFSLTKRYRKRENLGSRFTKNRKFLEEKKPLNMTLKMH